MGLPRELKHVRLCMGQVCDNRDCEFVDPKNHRTSYYINVAILIY